MTSRSNNPSNDRLPPTINPSLSISSSLDRRRSSSTRPSDYRAHIKSQLFSSCICTVWVHEPPNFSSKDVVINPEVVNSLGGVSDSTELLELRVRSPVGDVNDDFYNDPNDSILNLNNKNVGEINSSGNGNGNFNENSRKRRKGNGKSKKTDQKLVFRAIPAMADPELVLKQPQFQISVSRGIAAQHGFHNRMEVILAKVPRAPHTIDHVELYFKDQYVGRADMWRVTSLLEDTCVHVGQKVALAGSVRATVGRIFIKEGKVTSGYVSTSTKAIFRSESAKYDLFLQLSKEMWQFDEDGEMYFEKAIQGFIPELLRRWRSVPTNHVVSVVLFARVHYEESELHMLEDGIITSGGSSSLPLRRESDGLKRWYIDYYKVVVDLESDCNWSDVFTMLKEEFFRFQHDILLLRRPESGPSHLANKEEIYSDLLRDRTILAGKLSYSNEGNVLEAINLALNSFDEHYIDRDLNRTGFSIVFVTAGTGHFEVDKRLLRITTERMIDNGIGLDLVCLTKMPLHSVPLFHFRSQVPDKDEEAAVNASLSNSTGGLGNNSRPRRGASFRASSGQNQSSRQASSSVPSSAPPDPLYYDSNRKDTGSDGEDGLSDFYSMPHWIDCSFYSLQQDKPFRADQFVPRCKMHEVQMMGVMENEISDIVIPYLDDSVYASSKKRPLSTTGSNASSSMVASRFASGGGSGFGNSLEQSLVGMNPKAARRLARERFDSNTLRDLDFPAPRPSARSQLLRKSSIGGAGSSLPPSPTRTTSGISTAGPSIAAPSLSINTSESPIKLSKPSRPSQAGRESNRSSIVLESHAEHPSILDADTPESPVSAPARRLRKRTSTDEAARALKNAHRHSQALNEIGAPSRDQSQPPSPRFASRPVSRAGSLRSISTFSRSGLLRPLEPMGKAPALVAASDPTLSAAVEEYASTLSPPTQASDGSLPPPSPARSAATSVLTKHSSLSRASSPSSKKSGYRLSTWGIWSSLTRSGGGTSGSDTSSLAPTTPGGSTSKELDTSATAASRRIQEMLSAGGASRGQTTSVSGASSQAASTLNSPTTRSSRPSGTDLSHQGPISIPSQAVPGSAPAHVRLDSEAEAQVMKEQEAYEERLEEEEAKARYAQRAQVEKQTLVNPSNPRKGTTMNSSQLLRWQHLFPRRLNRHAVKWRSMTSPACLPLTTLYLPSEADLAAHWQEYPHTLSVSSEMTSFLVKRHPSTPPALAMLREMASQRLAQGFQFIVPSFDPSNVVGMAGVASSRSIANPRQFALRHPSELFQPGTLAAGTPILLSMSNQIHRISYNRSAGAIDVKRYVRKSRYALDAIQYSCCVWPRHLPGYQVVSAKFSYPDSSAYNWTYLDSLIAGYAEEELVEGLRYWRTRFVLVPAEGKPPPMRAPSGENLDDEEIRLMGTDRLAELFARARWHRPAPGSSERGHHHHHRTSPHPVFRFVPTSLDPAASMGDEGFLKQIASALAEDAEADAQRERNAAGNSGSGSSTSRQKLLSDQTLEQIAKDMRSEQNGIEIINDRSWHKILYADTFTGGDLVAWLCRNFADVRNRDEAVDWGIRFQREGLFEHVHKSHGFLDGHYFYRLRGPYAPTRSKGWFRSNQNSPATNLNEKETFPTVSAKNSPAKQSSSSAATSGGQASRRGQVGETPATPAPFQIQSRRRHKIKMSRSVIVDVDPSRKSDRAEVAFLHHDVAHNPANGFNFQIHWLGTTSRFIEDLVQTWTRTVEKYGLRLIEAPIGQIKDVSSHNPFQAPLQIQLSLAPPPPPTFAHRLPEIGIASAMGYFEAALLRKFGFILDQEAGKSYPNDVEIDYESRPSYFEYSQYVHRSGVAFVQVLGGNAGFLWLNNRLFNSHLQPSHKRERDRETRSGLNHHPSASSSSPPPSAEKVRTEFSAFCSNELALESFWREVGEGLMKDSTQRERDKEREARDREE